MSIYFDLFRFYIEDNRMYSRIDLCSFVLVPHRRQQIRSIGFFMSPWSESPAWPLCYTLTSHQNCMLPLDPVSARQDIAAVCQDTMLARQEILSVPWFKLNYSSQFFIILHNSWPSSAIAASSLLQRTRRLFSSVLSNADYPLRDEVTLTIVVETQQPRPHSLRRTNNAAITISLSYNRK